MLNNPKQTGRHAAKKAAPRTPKKHRIQRHSLVVIRWLVFCFPAGLLMMWSDRCRWNRLTKSLGSTCIAVLIAAVIIPQTLPPNTTKSGVEIVSLVSAVEILGPTRGPLANAADYDVYVPLRVDTYNAKTVIAEPTPTPIPIYVYCNDGGNNYHNKNCRYVKDTSARVPVTQAVNAGFTRCKKCKAPAEPIQY